MTEKFHLISAVTCPWVQRAVIMLRAKGVDFDVTYINLREKPDWFLEISPHGKVPVLKVGDEVLFESNAIAEYLDEVFEPRLHPADPVKRAKNRAKRQHRRAKLRNAPPNQLPAIQNPGGTKRKQKQKAKKKNGKKKAGQNQANGGGVKVLLSRVATLESQLKNARKKTGQAGGGGGAHQFADLFCCQLLLRLGGSKLWCS